MRLKRFVSLILITGMLSAALAFLFWFVPIVLSSYAFFYQNVAIMYVVAGLFLAVFYALIACFVLFLIKRCFSK